MHPVKTYELRIELKSDDPRAKGEIKDRLMSWLLANGVESFVEGCLDVDLNHDYEDPGRDYYQELGGDVAPVSVYRYSLESLEDLKVRVEKEFSNDISCDVLAMDTQIWMDGWKESFQPFTTRHFRVRPPWEKLDEGAARLDLVIEPGMAFGTGQHATTRLCLGQIESLAAENRPVAHLSVLDVGTGTGILAIAAVKLGYGRVTATDIEDDAVLATRDNARSNAVKMVVLKGSVPRGDDGTASSYDLVIANILSVVLERLMDDLVDATAPGGHLVLSGILEEEEDELQKQAEALGMTLLRKSRQDGWSCLVLENPREA